MVIVIGHRQSQRGLLMNKTGGKSFEEHKGTQRMLDDKRRRQGFGTIRSLTYRLLWRRMTEIIATWTRIVYRIAIAKDYVLLVTEPGFIMASTVRVSPQMTWFGRSESGVKVGLEVSSTLHCVWIWAVLCGSIMFHQTVEILRYFPTFRQRRRRRTMFDHS